MKYFNLTFLALCLLVVTPLYSQVDSIQISGKYYKVYPIRQRMVIAEEYWIAVDDEAYFQDEENWFKVFGEEDWFTREAFDTADVFDRVALREELKERWDVLTKKRKYFRGKYVKAARKNPSSLFNPNISDDTDVLPAFSSLPDGDYVQLFTEFCYLQEDGTCMEQTPRVAAYFSMKNNLLDGPATWVNTEGDTLRHGQYQNGLRTGTWKFNRISTYSYYFYGWEAKSFAKNGVRPMDTSYTTLTYQNGVLNGPYEYHTPSGWSHTTGFYNDGEPSGNWRTHRYETLIANITHANPGDTTVSHKPILRTTTNLEDYIEFGMGYTFYSDYPRMNVPEILNFDFGNEMEEAIELEEESFQSHTLEYNGYAYGIEPMYYDEYGMPINNAPERVIERMNVNLPDYKRVQSGLFDLIFDPNLDTTETRGYFIDSLGARMKYDGVYELFYPNGQLFVRYNFENGQLLKEDTLFWDNGQAWDVIEFVADSNHYLRSIYDYNGLKTNVAIYDSLGDFLRYDVEEEIVELDELHIDGIVAQKEGFGYRDYYLGYRGGNDHKKLQTIFTGNYSYRNPMISIDSIIPDTSFIMYREYNGFDKKSLMRDITFNPTTRTYRHQNTSYTGVNYTTTERTYTENYNSWTGKNTWKYGKFTVIETASGIWREDPLNPEEDSVMRMGRVMYPYDGYYVTTDIEILKDGEPYTGKVVMKNRSMFNRTSKNKLVTRQELYSNSKTSGKRLYKYLKRGKKHPTLDLMSGPSEFDYLSSTIAYNLFQTPNSRLFNGLSAKHNYGWGAGKRVRKVKGQYLEGKPQGYWFGKRFGKLTSEIQYDRGEEFGTYKSYDIEYGASKWDRIMSEDSLPKKKVHYLDVTLEFDKGRRQGEFRDYNWYGDLEAKGRYEDDFEEGEFIRRYDKAYSVSQYKNGYLDGYAQTYLTFPDMDTVLLYDLNFQGGTLNGESNTYHINGKLAKRGFFLNGEPIDDYEAFDTLGFKYHYVKFQYGFPIEEKIWEENELSLRYQFDWKDSIPFDPSDLMESQSLERLLSDYGYNDYALQHAYYGRDRLVEKSGLNYHMTKFYPNDTIARIGKIDNGKKIGLWRFYDYDGAFLNKVNYFDSIIEVNDSIRFKSKGILTRFNAEGDSTFRAHIIEKMEKYDCAHTDHYEIRQLYTVWETPDSTNRMNGYVRNYYDNGVLQNEGQMKDGLPTGLWKYYDPFGKLNLMGTFEQGKRNGRWLQGDLAKKKYLGEICLNPNLPNLKREKEYRENLLDVTIINYQLGKTVSKQFFDLNLNKYSDMINE